MPALGRYWYACCFTGTMVTGWYYAQDDLAVVLTTDVSPYRMVTAWLGRAEQRGSWLWEEMEELEAEGSFDTHTSIEFHGSMFLDEWGQLFEQALALTSSAPWPAQDWRRDFYYLGAFRAVVLAFDDLLAHLEEPRLQARYQAHTREWQALITDLGAELASLKSHPAFSPSQAEAAQAEIAHFAAQTVALWRSYVQRGVQGELG